MITYPYLALFNPIVRFICLLSSSYIHGCLFTAGDGFLVDDSLEEACDHTSNEWTNHVNGQVHHMNWSGIWVGMSIEESLENSLDETDSWVDAATGNTRGDLDGSVQGQSNGNTIHRHVLGSILLYDLKNEGNEEAGHDGLNEENLTSQFATIIAAVSWAQLGDVVGSGNWEYLLVLREPHHGGGTSEATEDGAEELEEHDDLPVHNAEGGVIVPVLDHHADCYCWIKVSATNRAEHLSHYCNSEANANWRVG